MLASLKSRLQALLAGMVLLFASGCQLSSTHYPVVDNFDAERYLGTWYEIARKDHRFERGLEAITAEYSWRDDGGIRVINRGFNTEKQDWKQAEGKAYFTGEPSQGRLKVSFFGPFYGAYQVLALDENYQYALVAGPNENYLWILARKPALDADTVSSLLEQARQAGFTTNDLIYPDQAKHLK